jgi:hypothetical protein
MLFTADINLAKITIINILYSAVPCRITFRLYMTFWPAYKATRKGCGGPNCGGEKPHNGRKADCVFSEPEPPTGGEAYTVLLCAVGRPIYSIIYFQFFYYFENIDKIIVIMQNI